MHSSTHTHTHTHSSMHTCAQTHTHTHTLENQESTWISCSQLLHIQNVIPLLVARLVLCIPSIQRQPHQRLFNGICVALRSTFLPTTPSVSSPAPSSFLLQASVWGVVFYYMPGKWREQIRSETLSRIKEYLFILCKHSRFELQSCSNINR